VKAETATNTARRGILFYIIGAVAAITLILAAVILWNRWRADREMAQPHSAMDAYMEQDLREDLSQAIAAYSQKMANEYQSADQIAASLAEKLPLEKWSYASGRAHSGEQPEYILYCDEQELGRAILRSTDDPTKGVDSERWTVSEAVFYFDGLCRAMTIVAPYECTVYVNGVELREDLIQETAGLYPQLLPYETEILEPNHLMVYTLEGVCTDVAVEADGGYIVHTDEADAACYVLPACSAALGDELIEYCRDFVEAYVDFTLNKVSLWGVQQYTVEDGTLFDRLTQASLGLDWGHGIHAEIEKLEIEQFTYYENAVTCRAVYKMSTDNGQRTDTAQLLLVNTEDGWRVAVIEEMG